MTPAKTRISEEAAQWAVKIHMGSLTSEQRAALNAWVAADIRHEGALARARAAWLDLDRLAALGAGRVSSPQQVSGTRHLRGRAGFPAWSRVWAALAASLGAVSLVAVLWLLGHTRADTYVSGIGEVRKVPLSDGSGMVLNTSTETRVHFDDNQRNVHLASGEALFEVAKDPVRPFVVHSGNVTVTAVGTAFAVRKESDGRVDVTVTEGVVEVKTRNATQPVRRIVANQRVAVSDNEPVRVERLPARDAERRLAWRAGMIAFDNEPLHAAVAEFNRYSPRQIVVDDPTLAERPITGVFRTTQIDDFAQTAATALNAVALDTGEKIHIRPR